MALLLPTNLNLPAAAFVDRRTGLAKTVNDLRNWDYENVPIPVGFEVFVDGKWYIYQGQENVTADTLTGYFRERGGINVVQVTGNSTDSVMSQKAVTDQLNTLSDRINEITENLGIILEIREVELLNSEGNPLNHGGGLYEVGEQVSPIFGWKVYYNGVPILASDSSLITDVWLVLENGEENRGGRDWQLHTVPHTAGMGHHRTQKPGADVQPRQHRLHRRSIRRRPGIRRPVALHLARRHQPRHSPAP